MAGQVTGHRQGDGRPVGVCPVQRHRHVRALQLRATRGPVDLRHPSPTGGRRSPRPVPAAAGTTNPMTTQTAKATTAKRSGWLKRTPSAHVLKGMKALSARAERITPPWRKEHSDTAIRRRCPSRINPTEPASVEACCRPCGVHVKARYQRSGVASGRLADRRCGQRRLGASSRCGRKVPGRRRRGWCCRS